MCQFNQALITNIGGHKITRLVRKINNNNTYSSRTTNKEDKKVFFGILNMIN